MTEKGKLTQEHAELLKNIAEELGAEEVYKIIKGGEHGT